MFNYDKIFTRKMKSEKTLVLAAVPARNWKI